MGICSLLLLADIYLLLLLLIYHLLLSLISACYVPDNCPSSIKNLKIKIKADSRLENSPTARQDWDALTPFAERFTSKASTRQEFLAECRSGIWDGVSIIYRTFESADLTGKFDEELVACLPASIRFICHNGKSEGSPCTHPGSISVSSRCLSFSSLCTFSPHLCLLLLGFLFSVILFTRFLLILVSVFYFSPSSCSSASSPYHPSPLTLPCPALLYAFLLTFAGFSLPFPSFPPFPLQLIPPHLLCLNSLPSFPYPSSACLSSAS